MTTELPEVSPVYLLKLGFITLFRHLRPGTLTGARVDKIHRTGQVPVSVIAKWEIERKQYSLHTTVHATTKYVKIQPTLP